MTEERKRPQSNRSSGWLATIVGALLLVAAGFGIGLVAGTAYEEPELVAEHLAGRTTEVALGGEAAPAAVAAAPADDVAAAPPPVPALSEPEGNEDPLPTPLGAGALDAPRDAVLARAGASAAPAAVVKPAPAAAKSAPAAAKPVAAAPGGGFAIQVGAFATESTAAQLASELKRRGFPGYVAEEGTGARFKVRVGPLASRSEAEQVSKRLESQHRLPTWILAGKS
jgi:cell division septation protein DedD